MLLKATPPVVHHTESVGQPERWRTSAGPSAHTRSRLETWHNGQEHVHVVVSHRVENAIGSFSFYVTDVIAWCGLVSPGQGLQA